MIEYIKFWLAREVADVIVLLPLVILGGIAFLIVRWWFNR